jgi:hypothetical protein
MNDTLYSNIEFMKIKVQINKEIQRRGTFTWWDPLVPPTVGTDKTSPITLPKQGQQHVLSDKTYTINPSSEGSLERTKNVDFPARGGESWGFIPISSRYECWSL